MTEVVRGEASAGWPPAVFEAPVLRGLDARARREIEQAGRLARLADGEVLYRAGDAGESFFVVAEGRVALFAVRRGDDGETPLRVAEAAGSFGEEATVPTARRATAIAEGGAVVAEIPVHVFRRAAARSGKGDVAERLERTLRRSATRDLLRTLALGRDLAEDDIEGMLDAVRYHRFERGQAVYRQGDPAKELWLVGDGMVQIQTEEDDRLRVRAYLARGDFFGEAELLNGAPRGASAVASGPSLLLGIPARSLLAIADRYEDLFAGLGRVAEGQQAAQRAIIRPAAQNQTQHAFRDLYRLKIARSLLTIDLDTCVRCGHCAWACADLHDGVARLVRRGDKLVTRVGGGLGAPDTEAGLQALPRTLLLPNSCQHCENPACMVDCPTGAIGREPEGEVFIREALCTGCGACAKACPWDNIQMAPRPPGAARPPALLGLPGAYAEIAVKCDLCREYESGPACVEVCPTASIFRMNPAEELADVRDLLGGPRRVRAAAGPTASAGSTLAGAAVAASGIGVVGAIMQARGLWSPRLGWGYGAGTAAALGFALLLAYAVPKRGARLWKRTRAPEARGARDDAASASRSRVAPHARAHLAIGIITMGLAVAHAPWPPSARASSGGALYAAFFASAIAGIATALAYKLVPARLSRLERTAALPEDFPAARRELLDRLYREVSGRSELVKKIFERILLPYTRTARGPFALVVSGRSLREEERTLGDRIDRVLEGRGKERLAGLSELVRIVVELRALSAQRALQRALRIGLPLHLVTFVVATALLVLHVAVALRGAG